MTDGCTRTNVDLPDVLWERLDSATDSKKEQIVEALEIYFGEEQTGNRAAIERQIQRYQQQKARGQQTLQDARDMVEEAEEGISGLNQRLEQIDQDEETYGESLDELLEDMQVDGYSVWEEHAQVQRIATEQGKPTSTVLDDLRARSDLDHSRFEQQLHQTEDDDLDLDGEIDVEYDNWGASE